MTDWDDEFFSCPVCNSTECVLPCGHPNSSYLIIGSYPAEEEIADGVPFAGKTGGVLKAELRRVLLDFKEFRVTNLWRHEPNKNEKCRMNGAESAIAEAKDKKLVLIVGSEAADYFCDVSVEAYNGLMTKSKYFSAPVMICVQPTTVFHGGIGEFRLTMQKLSKKIEEITK